MDRNSVDWKGYWPACPTPFKENGDIDFDSFGLLLDYYLEQGMHGFFINGTTGEWFSQSIKERNQVSSFVTERVGHRVPVVVGVTTFTAKDSLILANHAISVGASGICSSAPAYSKTLPEETVAYFKELSETVKAPTMIYNWPHGTSIEIEGDLASELANLEYVVAFKDSTSDIEQFKNTTRLVIDKVRVFGNFMLPSTLNFMQQYGGDGTIGGGSIFGRLDAKYWNDYWTGNFVEAEIHAKNNEILLSKLWMPGGWRGIYGAYQSQLKAIMKLMGLPGGTVRLPRLPLTNPESIKKISQALTESKIPLVK